MYRSTTFDNISFRFDTANFDKNCETQIARFVKTPAGTYKALELRNSARTLSFDLQGRLIT